MTWERWKDAWYPGTYTLADGRKVTYTLADVAQGVENARGLLAKRYPLPLAWKHDSENVPRPIDQLAADVAARNRGTFGQVKDVRLHADGFAEVLLTGEDEEDFRQLPKTRFVSPQVNEDWTDPDGVTWYGPTLTHVAAVSNPVQFRQKPFQLSTDTQPRPKVVQLSMTGYEGETSMAEKPDKKEEMEEEEEGECPDLAEVVEALKAKGIMIPEEVTNYKELVIAIKASGEGAPEEEEFEEEEPMAAEPGKEVEPPAPVAMSMDQLKREVIRSRKTTASLKQQLAKRDKDRVADLQAKLPTRIDNLWRSGRIGPKVKQRLEREIKTVQLSADSSGAVASPLLSRVEAYEELDPNTAWTPDAKTRQGSGEVPLPQDAVSPADRAKNVEPLTAEMAGMVGIRVTK